MSYATLNVQKVTHLIDWTQNHANSKSTDFVDNFDVDIDMN